MSGSGWEILAVGGGFGLAAWLLFEARRAFRRRQRRRYYMQAASHTHPADLVEQSRFRDGAFAFSTLQDIDPEIAAEITRQGERAAEAVVAGERKRGDNPFEVHSREHVFWALGYLSRHADLTEPPSGQDATQPRDT